MTTGREFTARLGAWAAKVDDGLAALARQVCQETSVRVVTATPVDTGFLRGSWQPSIGGLAQAESSVADPGGAKAQADIALTCTGLKIGDTYYMVNNASYARRLEYGFVGEDALGRTYNQTGRFYVRDAVAKFEQIVDSVAADLGLTK